MIVLYILLGIILFFALLFSLHLKFYLNISDVVTIHAGIGPVVLKLAPKKEPLDIKTIAIAGSVGLGIVVIGMWILFKRRRG